MMNEILKKRIEEAADKHSFKYLSQDRIEELELECHYEAGFIEGAEYALSHQFISVEEALPELMERVLVAYRLMNRISICIMKRIPHDSADPDNGKWHWSLVNHKEDVIAWLPIPKFETKDKEDIK